LTEDEALASRKGGNHVDHGLAPFVIAGSSHRLAVKGDDIGRNAGQSRNPSLEALLKRLRVQRREDVAQMVVCGGAVAEGAEAPPQIQLLHAKAGDVGEGLRSGKDRQQAQQQNLVERIHHLPGLPRVRQIAKMLKKSQSLANRPIRLHRAPSAKSEARDGFIPASLRNDFCDPWV